MNPSGRLLLFPKLRFIFAKIKAQFSFAKIKAQFSYVLIIIFRNLLKNVLLHRYFVKFGSYLFLHGKKSVLFDQKWRIDAPGIGINNPKLYIC